MVEVGKHHPVGVTIHPDIYRGEMMSSFYKLDRSTSMAVECCLDWNLLQEGDEEG